MSGAARRPRDHYAVVLPIDDATITVDTSPHRRSPASATGPLMSPPDGRAVRCVRIHSHRERQSPGAARPPQRVKMSPCCDARDVPSYTGVPGLPGLGVGIHRQR